MPEEEIDISSFYSMMRPKNVCICKAVSEATLIETIHDGCSTYGELVFRTGASTKCGSCSLQVRAIYEREKKKLGLVVNESVE
ncbi:MAG: (2Fe-2S)-binding protein [Leptospiraceae bacterium]|nr:(2Fe-2S)-binding protein [Leptospiraceae bacterium]